MLLKIGELAKRTGLTVRTLHHYDHIGLLTPSGRSEADYRLYDREDIVRLHRIQALRRLHLSLADIADIIDQEDVQLKTVIAEQISALEQQINQDMTLRDRLRHLHQLLETNKELQLDDWLGALEMMSVADKYFTKEEWRHLREQHPAQAFSPDAQMRPLIAEAKQLLQQQVPPSDPRAQQLTARWIAAVDQTMPKNPRYMMNLTKMHTQEPGVQALTGVDKELIDYIMLSVTEMRYAAYRQHLSEEECRFFKESSIRNADAWSLLFSEVKEKMEQQATPESPEVQTLLRQWRRLFLDAWGNDMRVIPKVRAILAKETPTLLGGGLSPELMLYARQGLIFLETEIRRQAENNPARDSDASNNPPPAS
ncbi:MerR family transcriptional regulator [Undibacterium sp. SXout7W]|uniref:MerR family transcriptional regulator n=1 Tax=Undibacterium sp. SXout7W TaxID=3413049 RepID=UPI003BF303A3